MARRLNFPKAGKDVKMRRQGTEHLDDPGIAELARTEFRNNINERSKGRELSTAISSHRKIAGQARTDFEKRQDGPWPIVPSPLKLEEPFAKKDRRQKRRSAKRPKA